MRRALASLALPAILALAGPASAGAFSLPMPTATLTRFEVSAISLRDVTFLFELAVKNPYPVTLSFSGMTLAFSVEGNRVFTAQSQGGFSVPANRTRSNTFTVTLVYEDIIKVIKDYTSKDYLNTLIDGTLVIPLPHLFGLPKTHSFSYSLKKKIPAIKPHVAVLDFSVTPPSQEQVREALAKQGSSVDSGKALGALRSVLQGKKPQSPVIDPADLDVPVSVSFTIELANEARAELSFPSLGYELMVNGDRLVTGESTAISRQDGKSLIRVVNTFSSKSLSKNVRELFNQREGTFRLRGTAQVKLPDEISKAPLPLQFDEGGRFSVK
jgi:LEA14-like dessication related protein